MPSKSCSWCHQVNQVGFDPSFCTGCGHRADVARMQCDCSTCTEPTATVAVIHEYPRALRGDE